MLCGKSRVSGRLGRELSTDRKSTRLNSSHLGISYAVFCLKKKPVHIGLVADSRGASAELEEVRVPTTLPRQEWRLLLAQLHRANDVEVPFFLNIGRPPTFLPFPHRAYFLH